MRKIKAIIKRPNWKPYSTWISDSLENLQTLVGGYIETVTVCPQTLDDNGECTLPGLVAICNEEGRLLGMEHCCTVDGVDYVGPVIFVGVRGDEFDDIPVDYQVFKVLFPELWEVRDDQ